MSRRLVDGKLPARKKGSDKGRTSILELTPDLIEKIEAPLRIGSPIDTAFALQGINYDTLRNWVIKGHERPDSLYGVLINRVKKAIAEWELRDLSVMDRHAMGAPAEYEMEVVRDHKGKILMDDAGKPMKQIARDSEGNPIIRRREVRSDWRAAMERLSRRKQKIWGNKVSVDVESVLTFDNKKPETKEAMTFDERIAQAVRQLEEDV